MLPQLLFQLILVTHRPSRMNSMRSFSYGHAINQLVVEYHHIIVLHVMGDTHKDQFQLVRYNYSAKQRYKDGIN